MKNIRTVCGWRISLIVLLAAVLVLPATRPASATASSGDYLALGDSLAFGSNPLLDPNNAANFVGYPDYVAQTRDLTVTNPSCPGETSSGFISFTGTDYQCRPYRASYPLHVTYPTSTTSQLEYAVAFLASHPDTQLVTLNIGANDVFLMEQQCMLVTSCIMGSLKPVLDLLKSNLATIYDQLKANYHHQIITLTYYPPSYNDPTNVQIFTELNQAITDAATAANASGSIVTVADGYAAFQTASLAGNICAAGLLIPLPPGGPPCDYHASTAGQQLLAQTITHVTVATIKSSTVLLPLVMR
ncbi:MAG: SGNH/GDSL hydrolase family protein [Herpetosiphonaceae bacterium]|nr:SGNH/GDSL hydrolase family protein [Herpetosiphonaceae bacterium]